MTQTSTSAKPPPLNHLSVPVRNLDEAEGFFTSAFGFERVERKGDAILVLSDRSGFTLVLSQPPPHQTARAAVPESVHFGFFVDGRHDVDGLHRSLTDTGHIQAPPPKVSHHRYGFYFRAFGSLLLEVSTAA
jgi:catechol 2,3-dioxygenase-like lactoylglutathione lyase family enzyme